MATTKELNLPQAARAAMVKGRRRRKPRLNPGEVLFNVFNFIVLTVVGLVTLYPFLYTLSISLSNAQEANQTGGLIGMHLYPHHVSWAAYKLVLGTPEVISGLVNTIIRTVLGTVVTILLTCICAYPLAFRDLPHRAMIVFLIIFTMIFSGGLVPGYLLVRNLGLINTVWALVLPNALSAFNIIVMKNFFQQLPVSFREAAGLDGASEWKILFRIYMPLSLPVIATISLWTAVGQWNSWFDAMLFMTDDHKQVLAMFLQRIVIQGNQTMFDSGMRDQTQFTPLTIKSATVIVTILPIILLYPFVQKYFVKGIALGGVKE